jgi:hypothetical protein
MLPESRPRTLVGSRGLVICGVVCVSWSCGSKVVGRVWLVMIRLRPSLLTVRSCRKYLVALHGSRGAYAPVRHGLLDSQLMTMPVSPRAFPSRASNRLPPAPHDVRLT